MPQAVTRTAERVCEYAESICDFEMDAIIFAASLVHVLVCRKATWTWSAAKKAATCKSAICISALIILGAAIYDKCAYKKAEIVGGAAAATLFLLALSLACALMRIADESDYSRAAGIVMLTGLVGTCGTAARCASLLQGARKADEGVTVTTRGAVYNTIALDVLPPRFYCDRAGEVYACFCACAIALLLIAWSEMIATKGLVVLPKILDSQWGRLKKL